MLHYCTTVILQLLSVVLKIKFKFLLSSRPPFPRERNVFSLRSLRWFPSVFQQQERADTRTDLIMELFADMDSTTLGG